MCDQVVKKEIFLFSTWDASRQEQLVLWKLNNVSAEIRDQSGVMEGKVSLITGSQFFLMIVAFLVRSDHKLYRFEFIFNRCGPIGHTVNDWNHISSSVDQGIGQCGFD